MKIYLVRHGEPVLEQIDPEKPLSPKGRIEIERISKFFGEDSFPLSFILHSKKLRAKQTAEILGGTIAPKALLKEFTDLGPDDSIDSILRKINEEDRDFMIVGHLPFLNRVIGQLIAGDKNLHLIHFQRGKIVCLLRSDENWVIDWVLGPDLV